MSDFLREAGFDLRRFEALQERRTKELERMIARHKADALRLASRREDALQSSSAKQREALREVATRPDSFPNPVISLETPFLIWTEPLFDITSGVVQSNSWAKFRIATSERRGTPTVSFYFYWVSPYSDYAVIDATAYLSATGHLRAHAPWTYWRVNTSSVEAIALFGI